MNSLVDGRNAHTMRRDIRGVVVFIAIIWAVFALDTFLPLEALGLVPRTASGLTGILAMPFLHGNFQHLIGNSVPLAITLLLLAGSRANSGAIVLMIAVLGGVALWLFGRSGLHIGASGLVFGLIAFHVFAGIFERRFQSLLIAAVVGLLYATTFLKGVIPMQKGVSWEGHLFGGIAGIVVASLMSTLLRDDTTKAADTRT